MEKLTILYTIATIITIIIITILFLKPNPNTTDNIDYYTNKHNKNTLKLYYTSWCPHCHSFLPTWNILQKKTDNINFEKICCDKTQYPGIDAYPTIVLSTDNNNFVYHGNRTEDDILNFINKHDN